MKKLVWYGQKTSFLRNYGPFSLSSGAFSTITTPSSTDGMAKFLKGNYDAVDSVGDNDCPGMSSKMAEVLSQRSVCQHKLGDYAGRLASNEAFLNAHGDHRLAADAGNFRHAADVHDGVLVAVPRARVQQVPHLLVIDLQHAELYLHKYPVQIR